MNINDIKIVAGTIVFESKLSKSAKLQLLNFIQNEASDAQVKALLMDGEITSLDEQAEEIVNIRFPQTDIGRQLIEGPVGSIAGMMIFTPPLWAAWRGISGLLSSKRRKCGTFRISKERDKCLELVPIVGIRRRIELLKKAQGQCNKNKNPKKCVEAGNKAIQKTQQRLKKKEDKYKLRWSEKAI